MNNMNKELTALKLLVTDTYDNLDRIMIEETAMDHLDL